MKSIIRKTIINSLGIYLLSQATDGFVVLGGVWTFIIGGFVFALMSFTVRPILTILTFPLNLMTFGLFSFITNAFILYLLTVFVPQIIVKSFTFPGVDIAGFIIPRMEIGTVFAYIVFAFLLFLFFSFVSWLAK